MGQIASTSETSEERLIKSCERVAENEFKNHALLTLVNTDDIKAFRIKTPGTGIYACFVTFVPGFIHIYGDIGNVTYAPHRLNSFAWARSSHLNLGYITDKLEPHTEGRDYDADTARESVEWWYEEGVFDEVSAWSAKEFRDALCSAADDGPYHVGDLLSDYIDDGWELAGSIGNRISAKAVWGQLALKKFFELYERENK